MRDDAQSERKPKEVTYFEALVMMNDFIDNEMPDLKPAEIKLAWVIFRKTIGWNKLSDDIGTKELGNRAQLNRDTIKTALPALCKKLGIRIEQKREHGVLSRRRFTWPIHERVAATLQKASHKDVGGKLPPTPEGQNTPDRGGRNPPTQYNPSKLDPLIRAKRAAEFLRKKRNAARKPSARVNFFDRDSEIFTENGE